MLVFAVSFNKIYISIEYTKSTWNAYNNNNKILPTEN